MIAISIMLANIMRGIDDPILSVALPHVQGACQPRWTRLPGR
jgi:hypothetical protein